MPARGLRQRGEKGRRHLAQDALDLFAPVHLLRLDRVGARLGEQARALDRGVGPSTLAASVRAQMTKLESRRASSAALTFASMSSTGITCLPGI